MPKLAAITPINILNKIFDKNFINSSAKNNFADATVKVENVVYEPKNPIIANNLNEIDSPDLLSKNPIIIPSIKDPDIFTIKVPSKFEFNLDIANKFIAYLDIDPNAPPEATNNH